MDWVAIKLAKAAKAVVETSLAIKPGEQVAIAADDDSDFAIVQALTAAVHAVGAEPTVLVMPRRALAGGPATRVMAKALLGADVIIAPTTTGLGFTDEFGEALKNGARGIVMTATDRNLLTAGAGLADYNKVYAVTKPLSEIMTSGKTITVTCRNGSTSPPRSRVRRPASALPSPASPVRSRASRRVSPGSAPRRAPARASWSPTAPRTCSASSPPLAVYFEKGLAVDFKGGPQAEELRQILTPIENGFNLGELSIGTNETGRFTGNVTEDKKALGTSHFALGNSVVGGTVKADIHMDLLILKPTIEVDGIRLVTDGEIVYQG